MKAYFVQPRTARYRTDVCCHYFDITHSIIASYTIHIQPANSHSRKKDSSGGQCFVPVLQNFLCEVQSVLLLLQLLNLLQSPWQRPNSLIIFHTGGDLSQWIFQ